MTQAYKGNLKIALIKKYEGTKIEGGLFIMVRVRKGGKGVWAID